MTMKAFPLKQDTSSEAAEPNWLAALRSTPKPIRAFVEPVSNASLDEADPPLDAGRSKSQDSGDLAPSPSEAPPSPPSAPSDEEHARLESIRALAYEEGLALGRKHAEAEHRKGYETLRNAAEAFQLAQSQLRAENEQLLVELAVAMAKTIVNAHLRADRQALLGLAKEALALAGEAERTEIRAAPDDYELLKDEFSRSADRASYTGSIKVTADSSIAAGCLVETNRTQVDATIEGRLNAVLDEIGALGRVGNRVEDTDAD